MTGVQTCALPISHVELMYSVINQLLFEVEDREDLVPFNEEREIFEAAAVKFAEIEEEEEEENDEMEGGEEGDEEEDGDEGDEDEEDDEDEDDDDEDDDEEEEEEEGEIIGEKMNIDMSREAIET